MNEPARIQRDAPLVHDPLKGKMSHRRASIVRFDVNLEDLDVEDEIETKSNGEDEPLFERRLFYCWILFVSAVWLSASVGLIAMHRKLLVSSSQNAPRNYVFTIVTSYLYVRGLMHVATKKLMARWSPLHQSMPTSLQEDCAFALIDATTFFFASPVFLYLVGCLFQTGDDVIFKEKYGVLIYCVMGLYQVDRFLHLMSNFNSQRLTHHISAGIVVLTFIEWLDIANAGFFMVGFPIEVLAGKPVWYWVVLVRFTNNHLRATKSFAVRASGIDSALVVTSAKRMATLGKFVLILLFACAVPVPLALLIAYRLKVEGISMPWLIANFVTVPLFFCLDLQYYKYLWERGRESFWQGLCDDAASQKKKV